VLTLAEADAELQRLMLLKKNHLDEQYVARRNVRDLPKTIASMSDRLTKLSVDQQTLTDHADDPIAIAARTFPHEDIPAILGKKLDAMSIRVDEPTRIRIGVYRGLRFGIDLHPEFPAGVFLEGAIARQSQLSRDHQGPRAVLNALERLAGGYESECTRLRNDLAIAESQLRDYHARLGKSFVHERYLSELAGLRDQLKAGLSVTTLETAKAEGPSVSELANRVKSLKAAHSIEATPQRVRQKQSTAEEPVTARLLRRTGKTPCSDRTPSQNDNESEPPGTPIAGADQDMSPNSGVIFRERVARERQSGEGQEITV